MNTLYQRFYEDLKLTGKSPRTIETYEQHLQKLERFFNKPPDQINEEELRQYLLQMKDVKHYSKAFFKQAISAFRFFYWKILNKPEWQTLKFLKPQKEKRLPDVLSREEVKRLLSSVRVPRHYAVLLTLYSLGLRISEGLNLTAVSNIFSVKLWQIHHCMNPFRIPHGIKTGWFIVKVPDTARRS